MVSDKSQFRNLIEIEHACFVIGLFCLSSNQTDGWKLWASIPTPVPIRNQHFGGKGTCKGTSHF